MCNRVRVRAKRVAQLRSLKESPNIFVWARLLKLEFTDSKFFSFNQFNGS